MLLPLLKLKNQKAALAGVAQWIQHGPANQRVASLIPSLGHMPGLQARSPVVGCVRGNHTLMILALSFSFPSPVSKNK